MLLNSAIVAGIVCWAPQAHAVLVSERVCPKMQQGAKLKTVTLFDGPPSENADLAPDSFRATKSGGLSRWNVAYILQAGRRLYVECDYGEAITPVTVKPAASTARCEFRSGLDGNVSLNCGTR